MLFKWYHLFWYREEGKYLRHQCPRTLYSLTWYPELVYVELNAREEADVQKISEPRCFFLLFINAVLQLFYLYTGNFSISTKDEIAEGRGVLEHSWAKIIFCTKLKITPRDTGAKNFCILTVFRRKTGPYPLIGTQDNSFHGSAGQRANPQLSSIKTVPKKIPKERGCKYVEFFKKPFFLIHKWSRPQEWTMFNNSKTN